MVITMPAQLTVQRLIEELTKLDRNAQLLVDDEGFLCHIHSITAMPGTPAEPGTVELTIR